MPSSIAKALGLAVTKNYGKFYSMYGKQVPIISQVKDAQEVLVVYPDKRLKLTILVAKIPMSYIIFLIINFCRDMGVR